MSRIRSSQNLTYIILFIIGVSLIAISGLNNRSNNSTGAQNPQIMPPENLKFFTLGYRELVADSLWLRTIQDFDFCENKKEPNMKPQSFRCEKGWVFHMIDAITELAPQFRQPYYSGAIMLSVLVNDIEGASIIFDKAVLKFPNDYNIVYAAAYQALEEEHNNDKAAKLLIQAGHLGAPAWVYALAAKLHMRSGQLELAKTVLESALATANSGPGAERIQQRLDEVNAEIAKQQAAEQTH